MRESTSPWLVPSKYLQRHAVDLLGDILAEAVGDLHRDAGHDPALDVAEQGGEQVQAEHDQDDVADVAEVDRAGAGDLGHHAFEQLGGGLAQDLGADDGEDGGGDGEEHHDQDRQLGRSRRYWISLRHGAFEVARLFAFHHGHRAAAAHRTARRPWRRRAAPVRVCLCCCMRHANSSLLSCDKAISR